MAVLALIHAAIAGFMLFFMAVVPQAAFKTLIEDAGFSRVSVTNLSGGVAAIHHGWAI